MSDSISPSASASEIRTAGELLREARKKQELSRQDIASRLNLQTNIIQALETDDTAKLPAITYVKGYIRSYARIVNLDADKLIWLYEDDTQAPPEILPDVKFHTQASSSDKPVKAVTYLLIFGLVLLVLAWWQSNFIVGKNLLSGTTQKKNAGSFSYTYDIVIHPDTPFLEKEADIESSPQGLAPYEPEAMDPPDTSIIDSLTLPNSLAIDTTLGITEELYTFHTETRGTGPDTLALSVTAKSWIEVYDKNKQKIYMNIAQAGDELKLNGIAPFSVILGFSPGVKVAFNGKPFDHTPYENDGVARFKLGE
jgi:cytoskeleton protein RodZ